MSFLTGNFAGTPIWMWVGFLVIVLGLMAFDLGVLFRKAHVVSVRESIRLSMFYVSLALLFAVVVYFLRSPESSFLYLTGYVVELSLSMDNIFVMAVILNYFAVPRELQHRVLFYGILGVIILRGVMIFAGAAVVSQFEWVLYLFAAFLLFTGIRMLMNGDQEYDVEANPILKLLNKRCRVTDGFRGDKFFVDEPDPKTGVVRNFATPLFVALCVIESADVIFAVDSIPAIFAITRDPFVIFTSNIFAILGLRALFFALSAMLHRFEYLKYALSLVLVFIGGKILVTELFGLGHVHPAVSLTVTLALLGGGVAVSLAKTSGFSLPRRKTGDARLK